MSRTVTGGRILLYLIHHDGFLRRIIPLKIMFTNHHAEKLTPVAGGTSDMPPKTTGQEIKRKTLHRREANQVRVTTNGPTKKNQRRLPYNWPGEKFLPGPRTPIDNRKENEKELVSGRTVRWG